MELARYLVELERPAGGWGRLQDATASARDVAAAMRRDGVPVRFLRSVFVPEDDACFFLYEAPSLEAVEEAAERSVSAGSVSVQEAARLHRERRTDERTRQRLTPAEEHVARLVGEGRPTPEVAQLLGVSPKTVESHLFRVYRKLGIRSRDELARHFEPTAPLVRNGRESEPGSPFSNRARRANLSVGVGDDERVSRGDVDSAHLEEER